MSNEDSKENEFLPELRHQFEQYMSLRTSLDSKTYNSITMSSAIVTLLIGIGTFLVTRMVHTQPIFSIIAIPLVISVMLTMAGVVFFIRSYAIKQYRYPMGAKAFVQEMKNEEIIYNQKNLDKFLKYSRQDFRIHAIREYIKCIYFNGINNQCKSSAIKIGHWLFLGGMGCIMFIVLSVVILVLTGTKIEFIK
jgi:hypothetical protein